jgi:hypothetical protein
MLDRPKIVVASCACDRLTRSRWRRSRISSAGITSCSADAVLDKRSQQGRSRAAEAMLTDREMAGGSI